jgi:hypothetical protein
MKPSFAEKIEQFVLSKKEIFQQYSKELAFKTTTKPEERKVRIERLKSVKWQLIYLSCFVEIMNYRFKDLQWKTQNEKLIFYATAYNHSFAANRADILKWINIKTFPYGLNSINLFSYSEVANHFFKNHSKNLFNIKS